MSMNEIRKFADHPMWHDGEQTKLEFFYPIPMKPSKNRRGALHGWKVVAEGHIVDKKRAPYTLVDGIPKDELYKRGNFWCAKSPQSHIGPFLQAIDFLVPDGTPVLAVAEGEVIELVECNTKWGNSDRYRDTLNFMTLVHPSGELTQYCHLAKGSISQLGLKAGSGVKQGQQIATIGKTGWTDRDHLHFLAFREDKENSENPFGFKSLVPRLVHFLV